MEPLVLEYEVSADDFSSAGEASGDVKKTLKALELILSTSFAHVR